MGFNYLCQVHGPESDIDAVCVGPYFATMAVSFSILYMYFSFLAFWI